MNRRGELLFCAVAVCCSLLLLVGSLLLGVATARRNDRAAQMRRSVETLRQENAWLLARCESSLSLEEIERYAVEELGMQRLAGEQIIRVEKPVG